MNLVDIPRNKERCVKCVQIWGFFWSVFSRFRTEYGEILRMSPYSVRMWENTDQKILRIWALFAHWKSSEDVLVLWMYFCC